jgi:hypothetical protein
MPLEYSPDGILRAATASFSGGDGRSWGGGSVDEELDKRETSASGCDAQGHMMLVYQFLICILAWCYYNSVGGQERRIMLYASPLQGSLTS